MRTPGPWRSHTPYRARSSMMTTEDIPSRRGMVRTIASGDRWASHGHLGCPVLAAGCGSGGDRQPAVPDAPAAPSGPLQPSSPNPCPLLGGSNATGQAFGPSGAKRRAVPRTATVAGSTSTSNRTVVYRYAVHGDLPEVATAQAAAIKVIYRAAIDRGLHLDESVVDADKRST